MSAFATAAAASYAQQQGLTHNGRGSALRVHPRAFVFTAAGTLVPAALEIRGRDNGGSQLEFEQGTFLLQYPYYIGPNRRLLLVELGNPGATPKYPLWAGVQGGSVLARTDRRVVVQVKEGETIMIFTPDGIVAELKFENIVASERAFKFNILPEEAFKCRFQWVEGMLRAAAEMPEGNDKVNKECRALHELAAMVGMSKRFPDFRAKIINFVCERNVQLRQSVMDHFGRACTEVGDMGVWMKLRVLQDSFVKKQNDHAVEAPKEVVVPIRKGPPAHALKRRRDRAEADRERRQRTKGSSDARPLHPQQGKKGGKKK